MIDIHSHVLFGLDDGSPTFENSLAMLRMAAEHGTTDLICTPHANPTYKYLPDVNRERLAQLDAAGTGVRLYLGCDFHLSYDNIQDAVANPRKYTLNQKNYLLVEFSDLLIFHNTAEIFARLAEAGMIPIITHPERNDLLRQRIDKIAAWVEEGARVQVTANSLTGKFGRRAETFSRELLNRDLVHIIASDAHDLEHRPPVMDLAHQWLRENYGDGLADMLCIVNPEAALKGKPMAPTPSRSETDAENHGSAKWYQFWR
ncbi:MAG: CpsB/CapC family capsule biosynthesis tyrosine phosphatase [Acidobacteriota bacterium]